MIHHKSMFQLAWLAVVALALGACSDSSTTPEDQDNDTTAPLVASTTPSQGQVGVQADDDIVVTFNEAMNQASATGQVAVVPGGAGTLTWETDRRLRIGNPGIWADGAQVTVTVGSGLTDLAGNALAAPHVLTFHVFTADLLLLATEPLDGATGISRSANLRLQFTTAVDQASLAAGVTIADPTTKTTYPFSISDAGSNQWYTLDPDGSLPASTVMTVTVAGTVRSAWNAEVTLGSIASFHFTTGVDVDTTPPTIVSFSPADGATNVPADVGLLTITFSEPVAPATFEPQSLNVEFALLVLGTEPSWNSDNTAMTIALPTLPAGLTMAAVFSGFADASGNVQPNSTEWEARVAGTADIYPMTHGIRQYWYGSWWSGLQGSGIAEDDGWQNEYRQIEVQGNGDVHVVGYDDGSFTTARRWDAYDRLAASIEWLGFADGSEGGTPNEIAFGTSLKYLPLPMTIGTWTDNTTVTVPGEGTYTATFSGRVIGREDLALEPRKLDSITDYYYKDTWKVARSMEVELDGTWFTTMQDTVWYAPTVGPVREITREDHAARDSEPAGWYRTESWRDYLTPEKHSN